MLLKHSAGCFCNSTTLWSVLPALHSEKQVHVKSEKKDIKEDSHKSNCSTYRNVRFYNCIAMATRNVAENNEKRQ